jgi:glycosyltransferase involved in cell wall biosynthesis
MHILHLTPYYAPAYAFGGVVRAVEGLARALAAQGQRVTVLTTDAYALDSRWTGAREEVRDGIRVVRLPNRIPALRRINLSSPWGMGRRAEALLVDVDVVHVHELRTVENLLVTPRAQRRGLPIVLSAHGTLPVSTGRAAAKRVWDRWISPAIIKRIDAVVGLHAGETEDAQALWATQGRAPILATIPNGVDAAAFDRDRASVAQFRARWKVGDGVMVLFLGRLHPRKGVEALARAFGQVVRPDARLVIAGPDEGSQAALVNIAARDSRIVLTGYLEGEQRLAALAAADVFALPATGEGLSMAMLEAMAAGLPLLLAPGCHFPLAAERGAGLIVEPQPDALAVALNDLLADSQRRRVMGQAARRLAVERFSWQQVAGEWLAVYQTLISG